MKYVLKLIGREGGREFTEFELGEEDLSLAIGKHALFDIAVSAANGRKKITITSTVELLP